MQNAPLIDVARARRETPGCENVVHLNNAGAALMPACVLDRMTEWLRDEASRGGYETAAARQADLEAFYTSAAMLLNCHADEVAFVENATRAWDMAFYSIPFEKGDRILTSRAEYASNFIPFLQVARRTGAVVEAIPNDEHGQTSLDALRNMLDARVKLIAVTHVPTNGGLVQPAAEIGAIAREAGVLYLLDACQSVGQMPVDVRQIGCDFLSATGRKFLRGPRGTGLLYVRREVLKRLEPPFLDLHAATWTAPDAYEVRPDARRFENWEMNNAGKVGLAEAIQYALSWRLEAIGSRNAQLAERLRLLLSEAPRVALHDLGQERCAIVSFSVTGQSPGDVHQALAAQRINVSVSPRSYTLLDMSDRGLEAVVRASPHYYNTEEELRTLVEAIAGLAENSRPR